LAGRANAYVQSGDSARAISDYNEVIRLRPDDAGAIYDRGGAFEKTKDFERARADYNLAIKLQRDYAGEFPDACFAPDAKGERVLANWPACEGDEP
jgi:tetratricopeptide (TPR) repeat protein